MATTQKGPEAPTNSQPAEATPITQMEAVRRALDKLGPTAPSASIQAFAREQFGFELAMKYITDSKSKILSKGKQKKPKKAGAAKPAAAKEAPRKPQGLPAPAGSGTQRGNGQAAVRIEDIEAVQALVKQIGLEQLRKLIDLLNK